MAEASRRLTQAAVSAAVLPAAGLMLGLALWAAFVLRHGFTMTPDSMSYAALARGFDAGHPFSSALAWPGVRWGGMQSVWPPLYPAVLAALHAAGLSVVTAEFATSGLAWGLAVALGALCVRAAAGRFPWVALPILAGFAGGLSVAGSGWSESACLALLGAHYWLAATAWRRGAAPARALWFAQALAVGLAFLDRYAVAPLLVTAVLLPLWAGPGEPRRLRRRILDGAVPALLGILAGALPWTVLALATVGRVGAAYLPVGAGLSGALWMAVSAAGHAAADTANFIAPSNIHTPQVLPALVVACTAAAVGVWALTARRDRPAPAAAPAVPLLLLLAVDAVLYTALLVALRARYFFDPIGVRLMAPALYPALLAVLWLLAALPRRGLALALALPLAALILAQGLLSVTRDAHPSIVRAELQGPWCTPAPAGDCGLLDWLGQHARPGTAVITDNEFDINLQLGMATYQLEPYPYAAVAGAVTLTAAAAGWVAAHPGASVLVALYAPPGSAPSDAYGPLVAQLWSQQTVSLGSGYTATQIATGPAFRVLLLGGPGAPAA